MFTIILYLTDDADSTAFPEFKQDEFALPEFAVIASTLPIADCWTESASFPTRTQALRYLYPKPF